PDARRERPTLRAQALLRERQRGLERCVLLDRRSVIVVPSLDQRPDVAAGACALEADRLFEPSRRAEPVFPAEPVEQVPPHRDADDPLWIGRSVEVVLEQLLLPEEAYHRQVLGTHGARALTGLLLERRQTGDAGITAVCGVPERLARLQAVDRRQGRRGDDIVVDPQRGAQRRRREVHVAPRLLVVAIG